MNLRRIVAAVVAAVVLVGPLTGCTGSDEAFSQTSADTGVVVEGPKRALDGDLKIEKADSPPKMAAQFAGVGAVTHLQGRLKGDVTVTLPVPQEYKGSLDDLWIIKHDGKSWLPLIPQQIDPQKRTVSITTRAFSLWTLGTWQAEEAAAQFAADVRNLTSSDGAWVISDAARLTGNAPVTECRYPALTIKLDAKQFIDKAIMCPKFVAEGKDAEGRTTYDLYISNVQTYPVALWLNSGVTLKKVSPTPSNPVHQVLHAADATQRVVTLPGAGELVLTVRGDKIPEGGVKISGYLDFSTLMVDLTFAAIRTVTGFDAAGKFKDLKAANKYAGYFGCVANGSKGLAEQFQQGSQGNTGEVAGKIFKTAIGCMKSDILRILLQDYYRNRGLHMTDKEAEEWLKKLPVRALTVLQNAPVLVSLASAIGTVKYGRTTYLLNIIHNDPATEELYKALPTAGKGGFQPAPGEGVGPANGGQLTYVGTPCMVKDQAQPWGTWGLAGAYGHYTRGGIDTSIQAVYVKPEHKGAVESLFAGMANSQAKCELREDGTIVELERFDGKQYGALTDYRAGLMGWENSEYGPYGVVSVYDQTKGVVVHISMFGDPYAEVDLADIKAQLPAALDYAANKMDVSLGTKFTLD